MYGYGNEMLISTNTSGSTWSVVAMVLAIVGGILVVALFLKKGNKGKFKGFLKWLYDFLNFDYLTLDIILRALYAGISIYIILYSFELITYDFTFFLSFLIIGLVVTRILFEMTLTVIKIYRNTNEINEKLKK